MRPRSPGALIRRFLTSQFIPFPTDVDEEALKAWFDAAYPPQAQEAPAGG